MTSSLALASAYGPDRVTAFYGAGLWTPDRFEDHVDRWASADPNRPCLLVPGSTISFEDFRNRSLALAAGLVDMGIGPGDVVAVQLPNWWEMVALFSAVGRVGAVFVPVLPIHRLHELQHVLTTTAAKALVVPGGWGHFDYESMAVGLLETCPGLKLVLTCRQGGTRRSSDFGRVESLDRCFESSVGDGMDDLAGIDPDKARLVIFTSGTEARAKGCVHTWNTFGFSCRGIATACDFQPGDVELVGAPVAHTTGLMGSLKAIMAGGAACLMEKWDPQSALAAITEFSCTHLMAATTFATGLLETYDSREHDISSFRYFLCGGAPVTQRVLAGFREKMQPTQLLTMYGQSEFVNGSTSRPGDALERIAGCDGRPLDGVELAIRDPDDGDVSEGSEGEICYRGPGGMLGYWGDPSATAKVFAPDGWRRTGDVGRLSGPDLRVTGRIKDIIIRGGMNISIPEVEGLVLTHPGVRAVAAFPVHDERLGERLAAAVVTSADDLTVESLIEFLLNDKQIAKAKLPEIVRFVDELPTNAIGKVQKQVLIGLFSRGDSAAADH